jgi:K+-transporting ATPase KdpF subunit
VTFSMWLSAATALGLLLYLVAVLTHPEDY